MLPQNFIFCLLAPASPPQSVVNIRDFDCIFGTYFTLTPDCPYILFGNQHYPSSMARRNQHSQAEIKLMVLQAAELIIAKDGLAKLNVRNIAREIGYTIGSIYMVFNNMADLILHLKGRTLDEVNQHLAQSIADQAAQPALFAITKTYAQFAYQQRNRWRLLIESESLLKVRLPEWYASKLKQTHLLLEQQFERLNPTATADNKQNTAFMLLGGLQGICELALNDASASLDLVKLEAMVTLLTESIINQWCKSN